MSIPEIILGIVQLIVCIAIIAIVLLQSGKNARLSGTIAGGAETFFGKNKGRSIDAKLSKWTTVVAIVLVLVTLALNLFSVLNK